MTRFKQTDIGEIPENWEVIGYHEATLKDGSDFQKLKTKEYQTTGKYPIVDQGQELIAGYTNYEDTLYKGELPVIIFGDHTLIVKYIDFNFAVGADGTKIIKANQEKFTSKFLYYVLLSLNLKSEGYKRHFSKVREQLFVCPPVTEQEKITSVLFCIDSTIRQTDEVIEKARSLKKGLMQDLLRRGIEHKTFKQTEIGEMPEEWKVKEIRDFSNVETGSTPLTSVKGYWDGKIPWMSSGDIHQGRIRTVSRYITELGMQNSNTTLLPKNTVVMAMNGQGKTRGTVGILEIETTCNQSITGIIINNNQISPLYLYYNLQARYVELRNLSGPQGREGLNLKLIKRIKVGVPAFSEQEKIVLPLVNLDSKIESELEKRAQLETLKKGLMQDLLTGRVRFPEFVKSN